MDSSLTDEEWDEVDERWAEVQTLVDDLELMDFLGKIRSQDSTSTGTIDLLKEAARFEPEKIIIDEEKRESTLLMGEEIHEDINKELTTGEMIKRIISTLEKQGKQDVWKTLVLYTPRGIIVKGEKTSIEEAKKQAFDDQEIVSYKFTYQEKKEHGILCKPFTKSQINAVFGSKRKQNILDHLDSYSEGVFAEKKAMDGLKFVNYDKDFVSYNLPNDSSLSDLFNHPMTTNKEYAIVVSGESGSGKTQFAVRQPKRFGFHVLYRNMDTEDLWDNRPKAFKFDHSSGWHKFLLEVILELATKVEQLRQLKHDVSEHDENRIRALIERLYDAKEMLNKDRNDWVWNLMVEKVERRMNDDAERWIWGLMPKEHRLEKLAIVIDGATDLDFAAGLVDIANDFIAGYSKKLCHGQLRLIIVGTGADRLKKTTSDGIQYSLRTKPSKLREIRMQSPDLEQISKKLPDYKVVVRAGKEGKISRLLLTNARMCFNGVLPTLSMDIYKSLGNVDENVAEMELYERLKDVGGFPYLIDYAVRGYLAVMPFRDDPRDKENLFNDAFVFHLMDAVKTAIEKRNNNIMDEGLGEDIYSVLEWQHRHLGYELKFDSLDPRIFSKGIAVETGPTSLALKFMSTLGIMCCLRKDVGDDFESLISLHVGRLAKVRGFTVIHHKLEMAWPEESNKMDTDISIDDVAHLKKKLRTQNEPFSSKELNEARNEKLCVIFSQGSKQAQGGDRLVLWIDGDNTVFLDSIQCQHNGAFDEAKFGNGWKALGINWANKTVADPNPVAGAAGWYYAGLNCFRERLESTLQRSVSLRSRILATSLPASKLETLSIPVIGPGNDKPPVVQVWCREMLEPTISTVKIQPPQDLH